MIKIDSYSDKGTKLKSKVNMPKEMEAKENQDLLAQAIHVYRARKHSGLSKVKSRGEINMTTAKWYRQKGTGRARHGAQSAPIFVGGGVAHGPDGKKRTLSMPKKMRKKATAVAMTMKANENKLFAVSGISSWKKTKDAAKFFEKIRSSLKLKKDQKLTLALSEKNMEQKKILRNIDNIELINFKDLNAYKIFFAGVLLLDKQALSTK